MRTSKLLWAPAGIKEMAAVYVRRVLALTTLSTVSACGGTTEPPVTTSVVVTPADETLTLSGSTVRFSAQVLDQIRERSAGLGRELDQFAAGGGRDRPDWACYGNEVGLGADPGQG